MTAAVEASEQIYAAAQSAMTLKRAETMATADPSPLWLGPMHWFSDWSVGEIPQVGSLVYTIWDRDGRFVYVGIPNMTINVETVFMSTTSLYADWSYDQFVMDLCDTGVLEHLGLGGRALDVRYANHPLYSSADHTVRGLGFRWMAMDDPKAAYSLERALRAGEHNPPGRPSLNQLAPVPDTASSAALPTETSSAKTPR